MKERLLIIGTALALFSYGCGSSDDGGATTSVDNAAAEAAATSAVDATEMLNEVKTAPESGSALGAVSNMYGQLSVMVSAGTSNIAGFAQVTSQKAGIDTCVTASDSAVTYADCEIGGSRIDGTIGVSGDTINCNLTVNSSAAGSSVGFTMVGAITVTATSVNGTMSYDTSISGIDIPGGVGNIQLTANFDNVGLDANGCPISGSLTAQQLAAGGYNFGEVRAEYGPTCGQVQLYN